MRAVHVTEIEGLELPAFGFLWRPVRHALGVEAFGVNAYTATKPGGELIEEHDETGGGAGRHEEIYVVLSGHATFTVGAETVEAPPGTLLFCDDPAERRSAIGRETGTTVLAIGGRPGEAYAVSPWESYFLAFAELERGRLEAGRLELERELERYPENGSVHYNAACFFARSHERDRALRHLSRALELEPRTAEWALSDEDLDPLRDDPAFPKLES
jgi:tetratricopeptide (TPR) repeat protein